MSGFARVFFVIAAVVLRWLAWVPFWLAWVPYWTAGGLTALANWCERQAQACGGER